MSTKFKSTLKSNKLIKQTHNVQLANQIQVLILPGGIGYPCKLNKWILTITGHKYLWNV